MSLIAAAPALPRPRDVLREFGIYVHVPFCLHRCWYCDFNAYAGLDELAPAYMRALAEDARLALSSPAPISRRPVVTSVFFGGGTPSLVGAEDLLGVLDAITGSWPVAGDCEVTVECNPETVSLEKLKAYRAGGVTRLSFGVQSLDDRMLAALGRTHDAWTAVRAVHTARAAGFEDVNVDLIFGTPGEDDDTWASTLAGALVLEPAHVSCYGLTYEEGTPLDSWRKLGKVVPIPDDDMATRWEKADESLSEAGFVRYEISNWAKPRKECRHNRLYWRCGEYLGIGAGAHSHVDATRSWNVKAPQRYIDSIGAGRGAIAGSERISPRARAAEAMFLGLRRTEGVGEGEFLGLTGRHLKAEFGPQLRDLAAKGLLTWDGDRARLTPRGTLLANDAVTAFL